MKFKNLVLCSDLDGTFLNEENHISMLSVSGVSAAVSESSELVKSYADIITCSNKDGAVADLISKL